MRTKTPSPEAISWFSSSDLIKGVNRQQGQFESDGNIVNFPLNDKSASPDSGAQILPHEYRQSGNTRTQFNRGLRIFMQLCASSTKPLAPCLRCADEVMWEPLDRALHQLQ